MKPINFPESNKNLSRPKGTTKEQCTSLPILQDNDFCISCWQGTWKDRIRFLFTGVCWLSVWSGVTQPPVKITTEVPFINVSTDIGSTHDDFVEGHAGELQ